MTDIKDRQSTRDKYLINLNNFKVIKKIKSGGFGSVYHIKDKKTNQEFAAKILTTEDDEQSKKMINREIGIMIRLQHPTIIQFHGYSLQDFNNQDNVTIIMNIAKNGSLATLLQNVQKGLADPSYDNTARQKILIGISYGMMHLHRNHIIHRDLKPGNILLDEFFNPKITDFGLSKIYQNDHSQSQTQSYGTSIYMAPEVIRGDRYNGKADVYSFAILMFEVLTDTFPYPAFQNGKMSLFQFNNKVVGEKMRPAFTVPVKESLKKLIIQCWSDDQNKRPTFEEIFNKIAFNLEDSVYDVFADDEEYKFYLDGVDVDEVLSYSYEIQECSEKKNDNSEKLIDQIVKENEKLRKDNEKLKNDNENILKEMKKHGEMIKELINDNRKLKTEIDEIKRKISNSEKSEVKPKNIKNDKTTNKSHFKPAIKSYDKPIDISDHKLDIQTFSYKEGEDFNGIMKYLTDISGRNIHDNGTIEITSNSIRSIDKHPKNLVDYKNNENYSSKEKSSIVPYVCFDFKDRMIQPTSYTIKSSHSGDSCHHLRNWVIEVSKDSENWITIDRHNDDSNLNANVVVHNFDIQEKPSGFYRFIRLRLTGRTWSKCGDDNYVFFRKLEFYGKLAVQKGH